MALHALDAAPTTTIDDTTGSTPDSSVARRPGGRIARGVAATALGVAAVAHMPVAIEHLAHLPYLGWSFVAFVVIAATLAGSLLVESRTVVWAAALLLSAGALALYAVSRQWGLPGTDDDIGDWANTAGLVCAAAETVVVLVSGTVLVGRVRAARRHREATSAEQV
jgi:hypothetical protein